MPTVPPPPDPAPTVFDRLRHKLDEHAVRDRPLWQRIVYPILGFAAIIGGLFAAVMPVVPGGLLIPIGLVLLMCFHPRSERWMKRALCRLITWAERIWTKMFPTRSG